MTQASKPVLVGVGDVVQLSPELTENRAFAGCFLVVTELKPWGVQGYVQALGETRDAPGGLAYYRAKWGTFEETNGRAVWLVADPAPFPVGTAVLFTDQTDARRGVQAGTIAEALPVPSGWVYVVALAQGGSAQPVLPEELTLANATEADAKPSGS